MKIGSTRHMALILLLACTRVGAVEDDRLPADAAGALRSATQVEIYSLEPFSRPDVTGAEALHGHEVLGRAMLVPEASRTAVAEFQAAVVGWNGLVALCFDPRHALRIVDDGRVYDYLLCYDCNAMEVRRDGVPLAKVGITGSPRVLDELMEGLGLALSQTADRPPSPEVVARRAADRARWLEGMPASVHPLWEATERFHHGGGLSNAELAALRAALEAEFPDTTARVRSLLRWFGSGQGPWTGFPGWESVPGALLLEFSTEDLLSAVDMDAFDPAHREGVARLFAGWHFVNRRAEDRHLIPGELRRALLEHTLSTGDAGDEDRHRRARRAFEDA